MSTWVVPITWTSSQTVTASQMNGLRDNLVFLKGFADLITNATTADTGTATYLNVVRASSSDSTFQASVYGDSVARFAILAGGGLLWSDGAGAGDTNLYRSGANALKTDDSFTVANVNGFAAIGTTTGDTAVGVTVTGDVDYRMAINSSGKVWWGNGVSPVDTNLYRYGIACLVSDQAIWGYGGLITLVKAGVPADGDFATAAQQSGLIAVDTTNSRIYVRVGTTWKYAALT